jgi:ATP-dependent RNA helicase DDX52/ROK1
LAAISPTGTGKTLSYVLPILASLGSPSASKDDAGNGIRAIVLAPTRELAHQIHNEFLKLAEGRKWRIVLFSKATANTISDKNAQDKVGMCNSVQMISPISNRSYRRLNQHTSPSRCLSSVWRSVAQQVSTLARPLNLKTNILLYSVRHLILDEADRMLDQEFLEQIEEIVAACSHVDLQKAVFSATLPAGAENIAMKMLRDPIRVVVGLKLVLYFVNHRNVLTHIIIQRHTATTNCPISHLCC